MPMSYYVIAVSMFALAVAQLILGSGIGLSLWNYYDTGLKNVPPLGKTDELGVWSTRIQQKSSRWMEPLQLWLIIGHGFIGLLMVFLGPLFSWWYPTLDLAQAHRIGPDYLVVATFFFFYVATVSAVSEFYRRKLVAWSKVVYRHRADLEGTYVMLYINQFRRLRMVNVPLALVALGFAIYGCSQIWLDR